MTEPAAREPSEDRVPDESGLLLHRLYGRSKGHPLRARQQQLIDELLPKLEIPAFARSSAPGAQSPALSARALFGDDRPLALEIGFGKGEHLAFQAARHPDWGFLGAEPYLNGVAALAGEIADRGLPNIRVHHGNGLDVLERLADRALDRCYLLHPDPWPKARHKKRRFVNDGPIALLAAKMKPGGEFRIATDHPRYLRHTLAVMARQPQFRWLAETPADWENRPDDWPDTRFGAKALALGHELWRLIYRRI